MKTILFLAALLALAIPAHGDFRNWTRNDGKTAQLELLEVAETGGEKTGKFRTRNGQIFEIKASGLSDADSKALDEWKPADTATDAAAATAATDSPESVFDKILDGNLVRLEGRSLRKFRDFKKPQKYYAFYYTASWCPPCQTFTPTLVQFYEDNKNDNFEIVLISSDRDERDMTGYAVDKKMAWPQLSLKKADDFKKKHDHGVRGIPSLIVCDLEGTNLGNFRSNLDGLAELVK